MMNSTRKLSFARVKSLALLAGREHAAVKSLARWVAEASGAVDGETAFSIGQGCWHL